MGTESEETKRQAISTHERIETIRIETITSASKYSYVALLVFGGVLMATTFRGLRKGHRTGRSLIRALVVLCMTFVAYVRCRRFVVELLEQLPMLRWGIRHIFPNAVPAR